MLGDDRIRLIAMENEETFQRKCIDRQKNEHEGEDIQVKKRGFEGSEGLDGSEGSVGPDGQLIQNGSKGSNSSVSGLFGSSRGLLKVHTFQRLSKQSRLVQNGQMVQIGQIQT